MTAKINGKSYDHGQMRLEIIAAGKSTGAMKVFSDISYEDGVERGDQIGANRIPEQQTEGQYSPKGSCTFFRDGLDFLVDWFAENNLSWYDTEFQLSIEYWNKGEVAKVDTLPRVYWASRKFSSSEGADANKISMDLKLLGVIYINGVGPFNERL